MNDNKRIYPQGKLCISSVQKKEEGFEDYRYMAYLAATEKGFYAVRNPENMGISQEDFEGTLKNEYPVFILLVGTIDSEVVNKEFEIAKENCLPLLIFIKKYDGKISKKTENIIKKLSSIAYDYQCTTFDNCEELYQEVSLRLERYIVDKATKSPKLQKGVGLAYRLNRRLMSKAKRQIIIYQRTSILILGPRSTVNYECLFYRELLDWLKKADEDVEFLHVFSWTETMNEMKNHGDQYNLHLAKTNLNLLYEQFENMNRLQSLNIRYSNMENSVSYVITDTNLVFVIPIEDERYTIELPSNIMKVAEIEKIKDELLPKTKAVRRSQIESIYNNIGGSIVL